MFFVMLISAFLLEELSSKYMYLQSSFYVTLYFIWFIGRMAG